MAWDFREIALATAQGLRERAEAIDAEQAVHGLDQLREIDLHEPVAQGLAQTGRGVLREVPFPGTDPGHRGDRPQRRDRLRCDLVLTPEPGQRLADPIEQIVEADRAAGGLFEARSLGDAPAGLPATEACWLELKAGGRAHLAGGWAAPARDYGSTLKTCLADIAKLAEEGDVREGGLLLVVFGPEERYARESVEGVVHAALDASMPVASPEHEGFEINDRIGNTWCGVGLIPVRTP